MGITKARSFVLLAVAAVFGVGALQCAVTAPPPNMDQSTETIGAVGGIVTTANATVDVPPGALQADTVLTIEDVPTAPMLTQGIAVGPAILCEPEGTMFADPVTLTLSFKKTLLPPGKTVSDIVVYTAAAGSPDYVPLVTTLALDGAHVIAQTTHFSYFVPIIPGPMAMHDSGTFDALPPPQDSTMPTDTTTPPPPKDARPPKDTGSVDSTVMDSADTSPPADTGMDSGVVDTGTVMDTGTVTDTGTVMPDTSTPDTGAADTGTVADTGSDTGSGAAEGGADAGDDAD